MTRALFILLATATAAVAQPVKKPQASSAAEFKPAELAKLAVIVTASGKLGVQNPTDSQRLVEDTFLECLLAKGYILAARSDVDSVVREKKFQESGLTEELAKSVGKVLNVPAVLLVRVTELSTNQQNQTSRAVIGARLVSVETGAILWTGNHTDIGPTSRGVGAVAVTSSAALAEAFPGKPRTVTTDPRPIDPKAVPKLAVLTVDAVHRRSGFGPKRATPQSDRDRGVEDVFVQVLLQKGYKLVSRSDLEAVVKEQAFQKSGLTDDNAVAAGKLLNVPAVLLVGVSESSTNSVPGRIGSKGSKGSKPGVLGRAAVGARLVDVATGEVRWTHAEYRAELVANKEDAADLLAEVAKHVAQFLPPEPDSSRGLLEQAMLLDAMGQVSAAKRSYRELTERYANTAEGKRAAARLKKLGN